MEEAKQIFSQVSFALSICLGIWQIMKFTPVGAFIEGVMRWLLQPLGLSLGLSSAYSPLRNYEGCVLKRVLCLTTTDHLPGAVPSEPRERLSVNYLGKEHKIEKKGERLYVDDKMSYYIAPKIWDSFSDAMGRLMAANAVCIKGYKEIWEGVATGDVMSLPEVLDSFILDNNYLTASNCNILLPVNLSISEEKVPKFLNLVGLVLTNKVRWFISSPFSIMSAVVEFFTPLRVWFYAQINMLFCWVMHLTCDQLRYSQRREAYSLGIWVENLKPSNDIQSRVVRADTCVVPLAGGAKVNTEGTTWLPYRYNPTEVHPNEEGHLVQEFQVRDQAFYIKCIFAPIGVEPVIGRAIVTDTGNWNRPICQAEVECNRDEFTSLCTLLSCIADNCSGSLKSYEHNIDNCSGSLKSYEHNNKAKAKVYGLKESVIHYAKCGFPPVYEVKLTNVVVA